MRIKDGLNGNKHQGDHTQDYRNPVFFLATILVQMYRLGSVGPNRGLEVVDLRQDNLVWFIQLRLLLWLDLVGKGNLGDSHLSRALKHCAGGTSLTLALLSLDYLSHPTIPLDSARFLSQLKSCVVEDVLFLAIGLQKTSEFSVHCE